jgi:protease-4
MIDSSYNQFLRDVSLGRNIPIDEIRPYADGRVMSGTQAVEAKLVSETGGFDAALEKARKLALLSDDCPVFDEETNPFERFFTGIAGALFRANSFEERLSGQVNGMSMIEYRYRP